jgi:hypothetical protein
LVLLAGNEVDYLGNTHGEVVACSSTFSVITKTSSSISWWQEARCACDGVRGS